MEYIVTQYVWGQWSDATFKYRVEINVEPSVMEGLLVMRLDRVGVG